MMNFIGITKKIIKVVDSRIFLHFLIIGTVLDNLKVNKVANPKIQKKVKVESRNCKKTIKI